MSIIDVVVGLMWSRSFRASSRLALAPLIVALLAGGGRTVSVGDIPWVDLPAADGREQRGRRPAVVLQDDDYGGDLPVVLVVLLTTARAAMRFSGTTLIRPTAENGLRQALVALVFQLRAIDRHRIQEWHWHRECGGLACDV
jgi:mRNA interferase MazF